MFASSGKQSHCELRSHVEQKGAFSIGSCPVLQGQAPLRQTETGGVNGLLTLESDAPPPLFCVRPGRCTLSILIHQRRKYGSERGSHLPGDNQDPCKSVQLRGHASSSTQPCVTPGHRPPWMGVLCPKTSPPPPSLLRLNKSFLAETQVLAQDPK